MAHKEINYVSSNGFGNINAYVWEANEPKAVIQLCHGFSEHALRYKEFAEFLSKAGYIVAAHDHLGHGKSANGHFGYIAPKNGHKILAKDTFTLTNKMKKEYDLPVILVGIGTGSLIARYVCSLFTIEYNSAIFVGTHGGGWLVNALSRLLPRDYSRNGTKEAVYINKLVFLMHNRHFKKQEGNWLNRNINELYLYENDPLCGFPLTYSAYRDFVKLARIVNTRSWANRMPKNMPIYLFSGLEDPIGMFGQGVIKVYGELTNAGCESVEIKLYEDIRHEVLFEMNKSEVYNDVLEWIEEVRDLNDN